jgi:amino acid adenylation domain-containing protein
LAAVSSQEQWTYLQMIEQTNQLARVLRQHGVCSNEIVGLCLPRQASMLVGLLAILKAGAAYLPLDANSPPARLLLQLQQSGARLLLTSQTLRPLLPPWPGTTLSLEELAPDLTAASPLDLPAEEPGGDLAALIFTSGSSGLPKGVLVPHCSLVNYTLALCQLLGVQPGWQFATVSTLAADLGNTPIFCALASGGCVHILDYDTVTSPDALASWVREHPIDLLKIVPSHLSALLESPLARQFLPRRALVLGGEALPSELITRLRLAGATCQLYNHYGPTETTIGVLVEPISLSAEALPATSSIPLGRPLANTQAYVLDPWLHLVPAGWSGELYLGGAGLAWGYLGQPDLTAERFVPDPYSTQAGARLYRTGDLVRLSPDGQLTFLGRRDGQIKLRGYRIELAEIEAVLRRHPLVRECLVLLAHQPPEPPRLVGYLLCRLRQPLPPHQLQTYLRSCLPEYMVPLEYVQLEQWPLTPNGKVDRARLEQVRQEPSPEARPGRQARSPIEEGLLQIWREVLGQAEIGIHDSFFAVGGHSLLAMRVMARLQAIWQVELPVRALFETATIAGLAQRVEQVLRAGKGESLPVPALVTDVRPPDLPLSFAQQRL